MTQATMPPSDRQAISVVILTRNEELLIARCLDSIAGLADEVIVVDADSIDRTRDLARQHGQRNWVRVAPDRKSRRRSD